MSATPSDYFKRSRLLLPASEARTLGRTGWRVSGIGFGGYRLEDSGPRSASHAQALRKAILGGCNLVDTCGQVGSGASERLVGRVLQELIGEGEITREQVVLVTKASIESVREEIAESLLRLGVDRLDLVLLNQPEAFLKSNADHREYYAQIEGAFRVLEQEVLDGRIQYYGVASNTLTHDKHAEYYTSLEVLIEIAQHISPNHHFAVIEFPFNLFESGAAFAENNSGKTLLEFARARGMGTLISRPLNAFHEGRWIRLADFAPQPGVAQEFKAAMTAAELLESRYPGRDLVPAREIAWAHTLRKNFGELTDLDAWQGLLHYRIEPALTAAFETLEKSGHKNWVKDYRAAAFRLFAVVTAYFQDQASAEADRIAMSLDALCPELTQCPTLSQKALRIVHSLPGVDCILVGMRQTEYVLDALSLLPALPPETAIATLRSFA